MEIHHFIHFVSFCIIFHIDRPKKDDIFTLPKILCEVMGGGDGWRVAATSVKPTSPTENRSWRVHAARQLTVKALAQGGVDHVPYKQNRACIFASVSGFWWFLLDVFCGERILFQIMALAEVGELFRMGNWMEWKSKSFSKTCQWHVGHNGHMCTLFCIKWQCVESEGQ